MFRSIGGAVGKKIKNFAKHGEANEKLNRAFTRFLSESFPEGKGLSFEVTASNRGIVIQAPNKTAANELILRSGELSRIFREEKVVSDQIVIR